VRLKVVYWLYFLFIRSEAESLPCAKSNGDLQFHLTPANAVVCDSFSH
jgi:hypothetical protein